MSVHSIRAAPDLFFKKRIIKAGIADYLVSGEFLMVLILVLANCEEFKKHGKQSVNGSIGLPE